MKKLSFIAFALLILSVAALGQQYENVFNRPDIDGLVGGTETDLDYVRTTGLGVGLMLAVYADGQMRVYQLIAGTDATDEPSVIRPVDFDDPDNAKVWVLRLSGDPEETGYSGGGGDDGDWVIDGADMYASNTGNVGIGTDSPTNKLDVNGTIAGNLVRVNGNTDGSAWKLGVEGQAIMRGLFVVDGNVGLGTTDPDVYRLKVQTDSGFSAGYFEHIHAYTVLGARSGVIDYAVFAVAPSTTSNANYGVRAQASGAGSINYGIYGTASGATTNHGVYCSGSGGYTGSLGIVSDIKFKKNVRPMEGILDKVMMLEPKTFEMRTQEYPFMNLNEGTQYGLIAQERQGVFPELVIPGAHPGENDEGFVEYLGVDYIPLTVILVRAIQEQQTQIEAQQSENDALRKQNTELETRIERLERAIQE